MALCQSRGEAGGESNKDEMRDSALGSLLAFCLALEGSPLDRLTW